MENENVVRECEKEKKLQKTDIRNCKTREYNKATARKINKSNLETPSSTFNYFENVQPHGGKGANRESLFHYHLKSKSAMAIEEKTDG